MFDPDPGTQSGIAIWIGTAKSAWVDRYGHWRQPVSRYRSGDASLAATHPLSRGRIRNRTFQPPLSPFLDNFRVADNQEVRPLSTTIPFYLRGSTNPTFAYLQFPRIL
jgi:hypothetical protein